MKKLGDKVRNYEQTFAPGDEKEAIYYQGSHSCFCNVFLCRGMGFAYPWKTYNYLYASGDLQTNLYNQLKPLITLRGKKS